MGWRGCRAAARLGTGLGRRLFESSDARAWLYGAAGHGDVPPSGPGSAIAVAYLNLLGHAVGWPSPRGGAQALTDALVSYLTDLGGAVRTRALVTGVDVIHGRVTAVRLAGGERVSADTVIARRDASRAAGTRGRAPASLYRLLSQCRYRPATVKVDWALDGPIRGWPSRCAAPGRCWRGRG